MLQATLPTLTLAQERKLKQKLWLERLNKLEAKELWIKQHPLIPEYKPRLSEPAPFWLVFFRQKQAFECTTAHPQNVHIFAFEPEKPSSQSSQGKGLRKYLVTSYAQLWHTVKALAHRGRHGSFYEVIPEGAACKLYFDLEFRRDLNPELDGGAMVQTLIQFVNHELHSVYGIHCTASHVINLDASTRSKFSCHLIYNVPGVLFKDNCYAGNFVRHVCNKLSTLCTSTPASSSRPKEESEEKLSSEETEQEEPPAKKTRSDAYEDADGSSHHHGNREESHLRDKATPEDFREKERLQGLYVNIPDGERELFIDMAVYTRNRNFRLYKCVKLGKENPLLVAPDNAYHAKTNSTNKAARPGGEEHQIFLDSIITNVKFAPNTRIVTFAASGDNSVSHHPKKPEADALDRTSNPVSESGTTEEGYQSSPFPEIDSFVKAHCISKGGVAGDVRRWTYFSQAQLLVYDVVGNRWCENIGRQHRSNNIMILVDLRRGVYYQKCHDPVCRAQNFKSTEEHVPPERLPSFTDWDEEELLAVTEQVEQDPQNRRNPPEHGDLQEMDSEGRMLGGFEDSTDEELIQMAERYEMGDTLQGQDVSGQSPAEGNCERVSRTEADYTDEELLELAEKFDAGKTSTVREKDLHSCKSSRSYDPADVHASVTDSVDKVPVESKEMFVTNESLARSLERPDGDNEALWDSTITDDELMKSFND